MCVCVCVCVCGCSYKNIEKGIQGINLFIIEPTSKDKSLVYFTIIELSSSYVNMLYL